MKILITGGCGFLGHHLVEHFLKNTDAKIVILDRFTYASAGMDRLRDIAAFAEDRLQVIGCDLREPVQPGVEREVGAVDWMIHAAAETHVDNSIVDPLPFLESNVIGTHNLLMLARKLVPKGVFLVSTDEVYGPAPKDHPGFTVNDAMRPGNPYAASKVGAEAVGTAYANTFRIPVSIVNGMNFFGERQHPEKYLPKIIRNIVQGKTTSVHADATATVSGTRFYLHCRNFADALLFLMREPSRPLKAHVVGEREVSNLELGLLVAEIIGKPFLHTLVDFHSSRPGHDLRYAMAQSAALDRWERPVRFEQSLEKTVRWFLEPKNARWLEWSGK